MSNIEKHQAVLKKSSELFNALSEIPKEDFHPDDQNDLRFHIHAIQNIIYTQAFIKLHGKL